VNLASLLQRAGHVAATSPALEVEEVLLRCPQVCEVSVVGRPHPDRGEEVVALQLRTWALQ
jgi:acyl-coenzyme A synthetase/AMP-(fatty) acid ligase